MPAVLIASLADRYRIEREIGAGGMATVYLAHDIRHDRDVAIKVLHPELGVALGGERFLSEIKTTAKLQHPHILPLLDSGDANGLLYYVMPFVTGETLRSRLEREGQLPVDDALRIAREVADALGSAHSLGIIHRDIKPENILLHGEHAQVADFGIALAVQHAGGQRMTQTGLSLGTPQYMSPEQAMGEKVIDLRSDIYALGAVTYEMLVGEPPFTGPTVQSIVAKAMTERPVPPRTIRDTIPANVEHAVLRALAKLPADRWASSAEFSAALMADGTAVTPWSGSRAVTSRASWRSRARDPRVLALSALALAVGAAGGTLVRPRPAEVEAFPVQIELTAGDTTLSGAAALSPDGHTVVFVGNAPGTGQASLYVRALDRLVSRVIPGTEGAAAPVFSPDGKWIGFIANRRKLLKVSLDGGAPVPLVDVADDGGIDWSANEEIVIGAAYSEGFRGLARISAAGGLSSTLTDVDTSRRELSHQWPRVLADGKTVLFTIGYGGMERSELGAVSMSSGTVRRLGVIGVRALGVVGTKLVYVRVDGTVMAISFDVGSLRVSGTAAPVLDSIRIPVASAGNARAFLTTGGGLVYTRGSPSRRLTWVTRAGVRTAASSESREFIFVRLSPDERRAALTVTTGNRDDLWILDFASGTLTPLTSAGSVRNPSWSPDGERVLYAARQDGRTVLWWQPADGSGPPVRAGTPPHNPWFVDLSTDGRTTVFNALYDGTFNIETFTLDSSHASVEIAASPIATETRARFSSDGKSIAYQSDESGRREVYVRSFPNAGGRVQVSANGGDNPRWSKDGAGLFFLEGSRLISATLSRDPTLRVVSREVLFDAPAVQDFDVARAGPQFLLVEGATSTLRLIVVPQWRTSMLQRIAAGSAR